MESTPEGNQEAHPKCLQISYFSCYCYYQSAEEPFSIGNVLRQAFEDRSFPGRIYWQNRLNEEKQTRKKSFIKNKLMDSLKEDTELE